MRNVTSPLCMSSLTLASVAGARRNRSASVRQPLLHCVARNLDLHVTNVGSYKLGGWSGSGPKWCNILVLALDQAESLAFFG